jgi:hypothetical protein
VRHMPAAVRHSPLFVLRHARRMFAHTFRGCTWRTWLGLEHERRAFGRYKALRAAEREYLDDVVSERPPDRVVDAPAVAAGASR